MLGRGFAIGVGFVILDNEIEKRAIICMLVLGHPQPCVSVSR